MADAVQVEVWVQAGQLGMDSPCVGWWAQGRLPVNSVQPLRLCRAPRGSAVGSGHGTSGGGGTGGTDGNKQSRNGNVNPWWASCELCATFTAVQGSQGVCHGLQTWYKWRCGYGLHQMVGPGWATCELHATFMVVWGSHVVCHGQQTWYDWRSGYRWD